MDMRGKGTVHILSVALDYNNESLSPLNGTINDAVEIGECLSRIYESKGIPVEKRYMLQQGTDISESDPMYPTAWNVFSAIRDTDVSKEDLFVFFYSGHGDAGVDDEGNYDGTGYLAGAKDGETLYTPIDMDSLFQSPDVQAHPSTLDRNRLQRFEYGFQLYDFGEWVDSVGRGSPYLSKVRAALDRAIIYESHGAYASFTEYGQPIIPVKDGAFCGLNTYVPPLLPYYSEESQRTFFTTLRWYRDAGLWRSDAYNRYETQATGQ